MAPTPSPGCVKRLGIEQREMLQNPPDFVVALPDPGNILLWHYCLSGPPGTPYEGGKYLGTVEFPPNYPFSPPAIRMTTPSGRFEPNKRLCLSLSDYHPEAWTPIWNIQSILTGLLSFMVGTDDTLGSIKTSDDEKKKLAKKSHKVNHAVPIFSVLFPKEAEATKGLI